MGKAVPGMMPVEFQRVSHLCVDVVDGFLLLLGNRLGDEVLVREEVLAVEHRRIDLDD